MPTLAALVQDSDPTWNGGRKEVQWRGTEKEARGLP